MLPVFLSPVVEELMKLMPLLFFLVIGLFPGSGTASAGSVYGAFLLSREADGYVLAAVIAFALGVCVTLLCARKKKNKTQSDKEETP